MDRNSLDKLRTSRSITHPVIGEEDYLHTSVMIPLVFKRGEYHMLFEKRSGSISQGNEICFPGGKIDAADESSLEAAMRETVEELGIERTKIAPVKYLGILIANRKMTVSCHVCELDIADVNECVPNASEVESVFTIPVSFFKNSPPEIYEVEISIHPSVKDNEGHDHFLFPARELGLPERYYSTWGNFRQPVYAYRTGNGIIWGITARIILSFVKRIGGV